LHNSGVSLAVTYEFGGFLILARQNRALKNGGDDFTLSLQYQRFFKREEDKR